MVLSGMPALHTRDGVDICWYERRLLLRLHLIRINRKVFHKFPSRGHRTFQRRVCFYMETPNCAQAVLSIEIITATLLGIVLMIDDGWPGSITVLPAPLALYVVSRGIQWIRIRLFHPVRPGLDKKL